MKYCSLKYSRSDNLGDEMQSIAAEMYLPRLDGFVDRDTELHSVSDRTFVILNGWFKHGPKHWRNDASNCWPPSDKVHPAFIGFHIAFPDLLSDKCLEYYRKWAPIGCRDKGTMDMLRAEGIETYFSRCVTLTFPKRAKETPNEKVYIVEGQKHIDKRVIPDELSKKAVYRNHYIPHRYMANNKLKRVMAKSLLNEYKLNARLVITNLIHCAMPCVAMQIPVVFITEHDPLYPTGYRLDPIRDILPIYEIEDGMDYDCIDWNPKVPDISVIAEEIKAKVRNLVI